MTVSELKRQKMRNAYQAFLAEAEDYMTYAERHGAGGACTHEQVDAIQAIVCSHYRLHPSAMTTRTRTNDMALPRQVAMSLAKQLTPLTLMQIGECFGNRDHGTVKHAIRATVNREQTEKRFRDEYEILRRRCQIAVSNIDTPLFALSS